jgi:hypothetical protein
MAMVRYRKNDDGLYQVKVLKENGFIEELEKRKPDEYWRRVEVI